MPTLQLIAPTLPEGFCPLTEQERVNAYFDGAQVQQNTSFDNIVISDTAPGANERDKLWFRLTPGTLAPTGKLFRYFDGKWVLPHPVPAGGEERRIWKGTILGGGSLEEYDGGSIGAVGDAAGPMWEVDTDFEGRLPVGVGAMPNGTSVSLGEEIGGDKVTLTNANIRNHSHFALAAVYAVSAAVPSATVYATFSGGGTGQENYILQSSATVPTVAPTSNAGGDTAANDPVTIVPPVRGCYFIKRTARLYYVAT